MAPPSARPAPPWPGLATATSTPEHGEHRPDRVAAGRDRQHRQPGQHRDRPHRKPHHRVPARPVTERQPACRDVLAASPMHPGGAPARPGRSPAHPRRPGGAAQPDQHLSRLPLPQPGHHRHAVLGQRTGQVVPLAAAAAARPAPSSRPCSGSTTAAGRVSTTTHRAAGPGQPGRPRPPARCASSGLSTITSARLGDPGQRPADRQLAGRRQPHVQQDLHQPVQLGPAGPRAGPAGRPGPGPAGRPGRRCAGSARRSRPPPGPRCRCCWTRRPMPGAHARPRPRCRAPAPPRCRGRSRWW